MFGVIFTNHKNLRRILSDYGFRQHILRKDYPITGFEDVHYIDPYKLVLYQIACLVQQERDYEVQKV
jgi:NADH-quinone oxidoreductase subunit C